MKIQRSIAVLVLGVIVCSSMIPHSGPSLLRAKWLIGTWENKTTRGSMYETWKKVSDTEFLGRSYVIKNKDTIEFESIRLVQEKGNLYYMPTVSHQNGGQEIRFPLLQITDDALVFENLKHDFPQTISYTRITADSLKAEISGKQNGTFRSETFPMKRVK